MQTENIDNLKNIYSSLKEVYCPYLKEKVVFNSKGFRHLIYQSGRRTREHTEIEKRIIYLNDAKNILSITTTLQEIEYRTDSKNR